MKNLPEQDFWNAIRNRLLQYKEEPDDEWDKIAGALISTREDYQGYSKASDVVVVVLFAFLLGLVVGGNPINDVSDKVVSKAILPENSMITQKTIVEDQTQNDGSASSKRIIVKDRAHAEISLDHASVPGNEKSNPDVIIDRTSDKKRTIVMKDDPGDLPLTVNIESENVGHELKDDFISGIEPSPKSDSAANEIVPVKKDSLQQIKNAGSPTPKDNKTKKKKFRPSVYFVASPTLGFYKVIPNTQDQIEVRSLGRTGIFSGDRLGFKLEAGFQMAIARNLELYASGSYYQNDQVVSYTYSDASQLNIGSADNDLSYTLTPGESPGSVRLKQKNIGGGLGLMYHIRGRKLMHKLGGGLQLMQDLTRSTDAEGQLSPQSRSLNYNLFYRLEYSIHSRTSLFLQPSFTRSIYTNQKLNAPFEVKPYHAGLGIGVLYHF